MERVFFGSYRHEGVFKLGEGGGLTPFFRSINYESRLAASIGWQEDYNYDEQKKATARRASASLSAWVVLVPHIL